MKKSNRISINELKKYSGKLIKIAVIDTGVEGTHSIFENKAVVYGGVIIESIFYDNIKNEYIEYEEYKRLDDKSNIEISIKKSDYDGVDDNGHATAIAGIIHTIANDALIYSIKILDKNKNCTSKALFEAISWAFEQDVDIINLSLGMIDEPKSHEFDKLLETAYIKNIIIVSADNNFIAPSIPAKYPSVVSVEAIETNSKYELHHRKNNVVEFLASGKNIKVAWKNDSMQKVSGNSFASAHIAGIIALIKEYKKEINCTNIKNTLQDIADSSSPYKYNIYVSYMAENTHDTIWGEWILEYIHKYKNNNTLKKSSNSNDVYYSDKRVSYLEEQTDKSLLSSEYLLIIYSNSVNNNRRIAEELKKFCSMRGKENIIFIQLEENSSGFLDQYKNISVIINALPQYKKIEKEIQFDVLRLVSMILFGYNKDEFNIVKIKTVNKVKAFILLLSSSILLISSVFLYNHFSGTKYYNTFIYKNGSPIGVGKISKNNKARDIVYKIEYKMGEIKQISRVNSCNQLIDDKNEISRWIPIYSEDKIVRIRCKNKYGDVVFIRNYSDDLTTVELVDTKAHLHAIDKDSSITVFDLDYDEEGYISKELYYRDKYNNAASDDMGCYGKIFEVNKDGLNIKEYWLNKEYNIFASISYKYNQYGDIVEIAEYDTANKLSTLNNIYAIKINEYDKNGNITNERYLDKNRERTTNRDGIAQSVYEYNKDGFLIKMSIFDIKDESKKFLNKSPTTIYEYDKNGFRISEAYFENNKAIKLYNNVHLINYQYYADNYTKIATFFDENSNKIEDKRGIASFEEARIDQDNNHILLIKKNFDIEGNIIPSNKVSQNIFPIENLYYNKFNDIIKKEFFDKNNSNFLSYIVYEYDHYKRNNKITKYNSNALPISMEMTTHDYLGRTKTKQYFGTNRIPIMNPNNYSKIPLRSKDPIEAHKIQWIHDKYSKIISEFYYDTNGKAYINKHGYHGITNGYDNSGRLSFMRYLDLNHNYIEIAGMAGYDITYNNKNNEEEIKYFGKNNQRIIYKMNGYSKIKLEYDKNANIIASFYYDTDDNLLLNKQGYAGYKLSISNEGNGKIETIQYLGIDAKPTIIKDGYAYQSIYYDLNDNEIAKHYLGLNKEPIITKYGYSHLKITNSGTITNYYKTNDGIINPNL